MPGRSTLATLFYSYAHADEALRDQLEIHLSLLQREGWLSSWHDRALLPGDDWAGQIDQHLTEADLILLLVSADFLASDYCYDIDDVPRSGTALTRRGHGCSDYHAPLRLVQCSLWKTSGSPSQCPGNYHLEQSR